MVAVPKLQRKLFRDIKAARVQFGAVIFIIMLGVSVFIGAYGAYLNLYSSYNTSFDLTGMADYFISVDYIDQRAVKEISDIPGVIAQGRIVGEVNIDMAKESGEKVVGRVISLPPREHPVLNDVQVESGTYFSSISGREVLVEKHFADHYQFKPGDSLTLEVDGSRARFEIVGIVTSPEYIWVAKSAQEPMPTPRTFGVIFMPQPTVENILGTSFFNEINVSVAPGADRDEVIEQIKRVLRRNQIERMTSKDDPSSIRTRKIDVIRGVRTAYMVKREDLVSNRLLRQDLDGFASIAFLFPMMFLSMASLTIYVLLNRLVESQRVQIGLMRAIGYSKFAVLLHYLGFALIVGIAGSLLGIGLGMVIAKVMTTNYIAQLNLPFAVVKTHWNVIMTGIMIGILVPLLGGLLPAWSTMRMQPAEAMRPARPDAGHRNFLEVVLPFLRRLPYTLKLPLRNISRNLRRSFFMAMGVASAVILVLVSMSFVDAMQKALGTQFDIVQKYDARIIFRGTGAASTATYVSSIQGIRAAEPVLEVPYRIRYSGSSIDGSIMGLLENSSMYSLLTPEGAHTDVVNDGILLPLSFRQKLGAEIGDTLLLEPILGTVGETKKRLAGFIDTPYGGRAFMPLREVQKLLREGGASTGVLLTFDNVPSPTLLKKLYNLPQVASIEFANDTRELIDDMMGFFWVFIGVMLAMGMALGVAIIFNGVMVNVLQRTREIAIMRAVGMSNSRLTVIFTLENLAIGCFGVLMGIPLGQEITQYFFSSMSTNTEDIVSMSFVISSRSYIIAVISALVVLLVSQVPALKQVYGLSLATATKDWAE